MRREEILEKVTGILQRLVPDLDREALDPGTDLRVQLRADSMDVLNFVVALHEELGVDIPERDYTKLETLDSCVDYLAAALADGRPEAPEKPAPLRRG